MSGSPLRDRLRVRLKAAMRERDKPLASALRGVVSALENAEAVPAPSGPLVATNEHVAGATVGLAAGDAPRRELTEVDEREVVARELAELRSAAATYDEAGAADRADELRRAAAVVTAVLEEEP
jgi:uncharacterized protein YqeY